MRALWPLVILAVMAGLPAHADTGDLRWLVPPDDDLEAWSHAAAATWPDHELSVELWMGDWPPALPLQAGEPSIAFIEGQGADGTVVLCTADGTERRVPVAETDVASTAAKRRVLLILRSMVHPIEVADAGWLPESVAVVAVTEKAHETATAATGVPAESPREAPPILVEFTVGGMGRYGLDSPALTPALRFGYELGASGGFRSSLLGEVSADIFGQLDLAGIGILFNGASFLLGNEFRFGGGRVSVLLRFGLGPRVLWTHRTDNRAGDDVVMATTVRGSIGLGLPFVPGSEVVMGLVFGADMIEGRPPILIQSVEQGVKSSRGVSQLLLGGQVGFALGPALRPEQE